MNDAAAAADADATPMPADLRWGIRWLYLSAVVSLAWVGFPEDPLFRVLHGALGVAFLVAAVGLRARRPWARALGAVALGADIALETATVRATGAETPSFLPLGNLYWGIYLILPTTRRLYEAGRSWRTASTPADLLADDPDWGLPRRFGLGALLFVLVLLGGLAAALPLPVYLATVGFFALVGAVQLRVGTGAAARAASWKVGLYAGLVLILFILVFGYFSTKVKALFVGLPLALIFGPFAGYVAGGLLAGAVRLGNHVPSRWSPRAARIGGVGAVLMALLAAGRLHLDQARLRRMHADLEAAAQVVQQRPGLVRLSDNAQGFPEFRDEQTGIVLVLIPPGEFDMGARKGETDRTDERLHRVKLSKPFLIGKYEVTNAQYRRYDAAHDSGKRYEALNGDELPAVQVGHWAARDYCRWAGMRLPTEAEWEYVARALDDRKFPWGNSWPPPAQAANLSPDVGCDAHQTTAPVGSFLPNPFGVHDLGGNAREWCADVHKNYPDSALAVDPRVEWQLPSDGYVVRGGSWRRGNPDVLRCATRDYDYSPHEQIGFRAALSIDSAELGEDTKRARAEAESKRERLRAAEEVEATADALRGRAGWTHTGRNAQGHHEYQHEKSGIILVLLPAGSFARKAQAARPRGPRDAGAETVRVARPFLLGRCEVTNAQFRRFRAQHVSRGYDRKPLNGEEEPAVGVDWTEATAFCEWAGLRLPTEAEWEYAARGGDDREHAWGDAWPPPAGAGNLLDEAWARSGGTGDLLTGYDDGAAATAPVGQYAANRYGLHDLAGNVWEWCADQPSPTVRVLRGGSWLTAAHEQLRCASRAEIRPTARDPEYGFRVAASVPGGR